MRHVQGAMVLLEPFSRHFEIIVNGAKIRDAHGETRHESVSLLTLDICPRWMRQLSQQKQLTMLLTALGSSTVLPTLVSDHVMHADERTSEACNPRIILQTIVLYL